MILDRLETSAAYEKLSDRFAAGFAYLRKADLANLPDGRYEIDGKKLFAIVQTYAAKPPAEGRWEAHRNYADIQFVFSGAERMGVTSLGNMPVESPYDAERDVEFFAGIASAEQLFVVDAGAFAIFLPHDVHMPSMAIDGETSTVKKVVVKVRLR